jgi:hypothetical protein
MTKEANRGWFHKGKSGNPGGRPKGKAGQSPSSAFEVIIDRKLTVTQNGVPRDISVEEALHHRTYRDGLAGKRMAIREVLKWIFKREEWLAKNQPARKPSFVFGETRQDPDNADEAMIILRIVDHNTARQNTGHERAQLLLEPWAVKAALRRRRGAAGLSTKDLSEIKRCSRDDGTIPWPQGFNP